MITAHNQFTRLVACAALTATVVGGCSSRPSDTGGSKSNSVPTHELSSTAKDPDDVPLNEGDIEIPPDYSTLMARVEFLIRDIQERIAAGTPTKAHRSLDELDILLKKAPEIAAKNVARDHWKEVNLQSKELAAAHNELHEKIDEKKEPDYNSVAERIQKAMGALKAVPTN
jgi:hypothetical protein